MGKWIMPSIAAGVIGFVIIFLAMLTHPYDDSDDPPHRSGLRVYTDHLTGCQYVRPAGGGITPRIDAEGKPLCRKVR